MGPKRIRRAGLRNREASQCRYSTTFVLLYNLGHGNGLKIGFGDFRIACFCFYFFVASLSDERQKKKSGFNPPTQPRVHDTVYTSKCILYICGKTFQIFSLVFRLAFRLNFSTHDGLTCHTPLDVSLSSRPFFLACRRARCVCVCSCVLQALGLVDTSGTDDGGGSRRESGVAAALAALTTGGDKRAG